MVVYKCPLAEGKKARILVRASNGCFMKHPKPKKYTVVTSSGKGVIIWRDAIGRFTFKPKR